MIFESFDLMSFHSDSEARVASKNELLFQVEFRFQSTLDGTDGCSLLDASLMACFWRFRDLLGQFGGLRTHFWTVLELDLGKQGR